MTHTDTCVHPPHSPRTDCEHSKGVWNQPPRWWFDAARSALAEAPYCRVNQLAWELASMEDCMRCHATNPEPWGSVPSDWEVCTDDESGTVVVVGVICENCITPAERQAIDEEYMEFCDAVELA